MFSGCIAPESVCVAHLTLSWCATHCWTPSAFTNRLLINPRFPPSVGGCTSKHRKFYLVRAFLDKLGNALVGYVKIQILFMNYSRLRNIAQYIKHLQLH